jgi:hypothetical protein
MDLKQRKVAPNKRKQLCPDWVSEPISESVVIAKLGYMNRILGNFIDETMLVIDSTGPITRKCMFERFRLTNFLKWIAFCLLDEGVNPT